MWEFELLPTEPHSHRIRAFTANLRMARHSGAIQKVTEALRILGEVVKV
jgi:hypothetical protein